MTRLGQRGALMSKRCLGMGILPRLWVAIAFVLGYPQTLQAKPNEATNASTDEVPALAVNWTTIFGLGPLIGTSQLAGRYRRVYRRDSNPLWDKLYIQGGLSAGTSTFTTTTAAHVEFQPIAVFGLRLQAERWHWLGRPSVIGTGLPFASVDTPADPATMEARQNETIATDGYRGLAVTTLRAKIGAVALLNMNRLSAWYLPDGDGFLYDSEADNLIARGKLDLTVRNRLALLWMAKPFAGAHRLMVGPNHELHRSRAAGLARQRLGAMLVYTPVQRWGSIWEPTLMMELGLNIEDRHRAGELYMFSLVNLTFARH